MKEIKQADLLRLHERVIFKGPITCERCGQRAHLDTTYLRINVICGTCGEPLSLLAVRGTSGELIPTLDIRETMENQKLRKSVLAITATLSSGLGNMILGEKNAWKPRLKAKRIRKAA